MMKKNIFFEIRFFQVWVLLLALPCLTSCDDWLDVRSDTESKEEDLYEKSLGFKESLTGCYELMADRDAYGESLTISSIESLANLWYIQSYSTMPKQYYLKEHVYTNDYAKDEIKAIYAKLFKVIANVNKLIDNVERNGSSIPDEDLRAVIAGEAYAIRAFCHFDVLRLFGPLPQKNGLDADGEEVLLPYSVEASIDNLPSYYSYSDYVNRLENDLNKAESYLNGHDPVCAYPILELNSPSTNLVDDDFMYYRQSRLNYWAVKALKARFYLYVGDKPKAYQAAKEVIEAKTSKGEQVIELKSADDLIAGYYSCPSECLFYLSKYNLHSYSDALLLGGGGMYLPGSNLAVTSANLNTLYQGMNTASHNRYLNVWNTTVRNSVGTAYAATKKYYNDESRTSISLTKNQLIPMIRLEEVYLIAIEATNSLPEANQLYETYMRDHGILLTADTFASETDKQDVILKEYAREFFAEGQLFYAYKRTNTTKMLLRAQAVPESGFILPLPDSEFNPNN